MELWDLPWARKLLLAHRLRGEQYPCLAIPVLYTKQKDTRLAVFLSDSAYFLDYQIKAFNFCPISTA